MRENRKGRVKDGIWYQTYSTYLPVKHVYYKAKAYWGERRLAFPRPDIAPEQSAAIYARVDPTLGADWRAGLDAQTEACQALAGTLGLTVVGSYVEMGLAASHSRLAYQGLLLDFHRGQFGRLIAVNERVLLAAAKPAFALHQAVSAGLVVRLVEGALDLELLARRSIMAQVELQAVFRAYGQEPVGLDPYNPELFLEDGITRTTTRDRERNERRRNTQATNE